MGQLKFQSSTTGCLWMLPWFLMRDGPTQVSIIHNWLFLDVTIVPHKRWANSSFNHPQLVVLWMLPWFPHERWANSSFNQPQLVVYGCYHGSSWEIGQLPQVFNQPQLVVFGCCHGSLWEMCQLKFQSSTTGLWMLPWFLMRDGPTQVFNPPQLVVLWMFPWFLMRDGPTQVSINHNWLFMDVVPWFLIRDGPT